jgi:uroporphyrinogen decarboxylase
MGSDCVVVGGTVAEGYKENKEEDGSYYNEFGMKMRPGLLYVDVVEAPLRHVSSIENIEEYSFPDPRDPSRYILAEKDIARFNEEYFIIGDCEVTIFAMARQLLGMEKFLIDMMLQEPYLDKLYSKAYNWSLGIATELVNRGVDAIWFGDDFGTQDSLIMDLEMWRQIFKPIYRKLFNTIKMINPELIIIMHSDGAVAPLLPDLIEIGVNVFNPVQPGVPGHDPQDLQDQFGKNLSFFGAIDQQYLIPKGTPMEIEADVREKIDILGKGGGYMIAPAHILQADTPVENVEAFINAVKKYGKNS